MLLRQIRQVGITYVTHRYLWWGLALMGCFVVPQLLFVILPNRSPNDAAFGLTMILATPLMFLLFFLVSQAKPQLAHPRARLTPHFLPAHLLLLAGILITLFLLFPWLLAAIGSFSPLGFVALALAIGVPAIWSSQLTHFTPTLVTLAVFYRMFTDWGQRWWIVESAAHRPEHAAIVLVGSALIVAWLWRVARLTEEADDYQNPMFVFLARRTGSEAIEQRRIVATQVGRNRLISWIGDRWHDRLGGYYGGCPAGLANLLRYGFSASPIEVQGLFFVIMIVTLGLFFNQFSVLAKPGAGFGAMLFFIQFSVLLPGHVAGEIMAQRRPRVAAELLLPVSRAQFVDGLFAASLRNTLVLWLLSNSAVGVVFALDAAEIGLQTVAVFLLLAAATTLATAGMSLRLSVWPSLFKRTTVTLAGWIALLAPLFVWSILLEKTSQSPFVRVAVLLVALGGWLLRNGRHAWLNLELG